MLLDLGIQDRRQIFGDLAVSFGTQVGIEIIKIASGCRRPNVLLSQLHQQIHLALVAIGMSKGVMSSMSPATVSYAA